MKTFLVPVDFSSVTERVVDSALAFARAFSGKVELLHIVQPPVIATAEYALPAEVIHEAVTISKDTAQKKLAGFVEIFKKAGVGCTSTILVGAPVPLIREAAVKAGADFVIIGSHGHGKLYDFLVGSTASGVIKKTLCGVIIIPPVDKP